MRSKAYHAFEQKIHRFNEDIELIDVVRSGVIDGDLTEKDSNSVFKHMDQQRHPTLHRRKNSDNSRKLAINHLRATIYSSYVKDVYEELTQYLRTILEKASLAGLNSARIIGEHAFKVEAKNMLALGSWEEVCRMVADSVFQSLEAERSTLKLLEKISNKLDLQVREETITQALPYLEVRHLLVHTDGKASLEFRQNYPEIKCKGNYVQLNYTFISRFRDTVHHLVSEFDKSVINKNFLRHEDTQP
jgi:hypothetical protein